MPFQIKGCCPVFPVNWLAWLEFETLLRFQQVWLGGVHRTQEVTSMRANLFLQGLLRTVRMENVHGINHIGKGMAFHSLPKCSQHLLIPMAQSSQSHLGVFMEGCHMKLIKFTMGLPLNSVGLQCLVMNWSFSPLLFFGVQGQKVLTLVSGLFPWAATITLFGLVAAQSYPAHGHMAGETLSLKFSRQNYWVGYHSSWGSPLKGLNC